MGSFRQHGAAIIMALLVTALAAVLATALLTQLSRWTDQQAAARDHAQARELARSGIEYARLLLAEDGRRSAMDHPGEAWARPLPPFQAEGGEVSGYLEDLQGRWNLNNLVRDGRIDPQALNLYRRLLRALELPPQLADTLADWLDADASSRPEGAEDDYYLSLQPPYPAANRPLEHLSNLLRVKGYDGPVLARLRPHVAVLPQAQPVNVNTASAQLLAALHPELGPTELQELLRSREQLPFRDLSDYQGRLSGAGTAAALDTRSNHFLAVVTARVGDTQATFQGLLRRTPQQPQPQLLWLLMQ